MPAFISSLQLVLLATPAPRIHVLCTWCPGYPLWFHQHVVHYFIFFQDYKNWFIVKEIQDNQLNFYPHATHYIQEALNTFTSARTQDDIEAVIQGREGCSGPRSQHKGCGEARQLSGTRSCWTLRYHQANNPQGGKPHLTSWASLSDSKFRNNFFTDSKMWAKCLLERKKFMKAFLSWPH